MPTGDVTKTELRLVTEKADKMFFRSRYGFLLSHNGFRPGNIHTFIGISSGGKSTLVRSLIHDIMINIDESKKVLLWLSEESYLDFITEFGRTGFNDEEKLKNLVIESELSMGIKNPRQMLNHFKEKCKGFDLVFLDNITTSEMYEPFRPQEQGSIAKEIKTVADVLQVPIILIAHTGAAVTDNIPRVIDQNDIRGSKGVVNLSQFFYVLQRFTIGQKIFATLRITKHRGQEADHKLYGLKFDKHSKTYGNDVPITFDEFKTIFKQRNIL